MLSTFGIVKDVSLSSRYQYTYPLINVAAQTKYMTADDVNNAIAAILETFEMMFVLLQCALY